MAPPSDGKADLEVILKGGNKVCKAASNIRVLALMMARTHLRARASHTGVSPLPAFAAWSGAGPMQ